MLKDMETFDQASRGPLGAAKILLSPRTALSPSSLGALAVILCLLVDPFTQQVMGWTERKVLVPSEDVWTPRAAVLYFCPGGVNGDAGCKPNVVEAANTAIWTDPKIYSLNAYCSTGQCEWEPFDTIEYCVTNWIIEPSTATCDIFFNQTRYKEIREFWNSFPNGVSLAS